MNGRCHHVEIYNRRLDHDIDSSIERKVRAGGGGKPAEGMGER